MDRLDFLTTREQRAADRPARTVAQAHAQDRPAWYRIHVQYSRGGARVYTLYAWTDRYTWCDAPDGVTAHTLMAAHPEINWWRSHDIDAATGAVYAVPEPHEDGALPEVDGTFGNRRPPSLRTDRDLLDTVPSMPARRAA